MKLSAGVRTLLLLVLLLLTACGGATPAATPQHARTMPANTSTPTAHADDKPTIEPPPDGTYMVLVADLEPIGTVQRDVSRGIVADLQQRLEYDVLYSRIVTRRYPRVVRSAQEAYEVAETSGAIIIIWGNYNTNRIELEIQIGDTRPYPAISFPRETLEETANVRVRLTDEHTQSVAPNVLVIQNVLQNADGNFYELLRTWALLQDTSVPRGVLVGNSVATHVHQMAIVSFDDPNQSSKELKNALALSPNNALLAIYRIWIHMRMGQTHLLEDDILRSIALGPPDWTDPLYSTAYEAMASNNITPMITPYEQIITLRPHDWFPPYLLGHMLYLAGARARARDLIEQSIALEPDANFPYTVAVLLALREGRIDEAQKLLHTMHRRFPDTYISYRVFNAFFGSVFPNPLEPTFSSLGNLAFGHYDAAIESARHGLTPDDSQADLHFMLGYAHCNRGEYEQAERAYSKAISLAPDFVLLRLLRAEVRDKLDNPRGAAADIATAQQSDQATLLADMIALAENDNLSCRNLLLDPKDTIVPTTQHTTP